jgi:ATP-dependent DNA helicase RecG
MATYPASEGLTSVQIAALVHEHRADIPNALEPLPARLRVLERLPDLPAALDAAHFGDQEGGRRRLAFDEFLLLQIALLRRRARRREGALAPALAPPGALTARWLAIRCRSPQPATSAARWPRSTRASRSSARCSGC